MQKTIQSAVTLLWLLSAASLGAEETPAFPQPQKEHEWLKQFAGEWEAESEAVAGPGQPAMKCKGTMKARMLGGFWVVKELKNEAGGVTVDAVQTIGYDAKSKKYVGTWIDSVLNHLWTYTGSVDESGKILTLEAEGPNLLKEGETAKYRDTYEMKSKDHIIATSLMLGEDGKWVPFMKGNLRRVK